MRQAHKKQAFFFSPPPALMLAHNIKGNKKAHKQHVFRARIQSTLLDDEAASKKGHLHEDLISELRAVSVRGTDLELQASLNTTNSSSHIENPESPS